MIRLGLKVLIVVLIFVQPAWATKVFEITFESQTCDTSPSDGGKYDGCCYDYYANTPTIRCALSSPQGSNYYENVTIDSERGALTEFYRGTGNCNGTAYTVGTTATYYLGAFIRIEKIVSDVWDDSASANDFDKLIEMTGSNFRYGMYSGWPQGKYTGAANGKFTMHPWSASSVMPNWTCGDGGTDDNTTQNVSPYNSANPYLCDYNKWYAIVLEVVPKTDATGSMTMYINGTKVLEKTNCVSSEVGATITHTGVHGTIGQPGYDAPAHKRQVDHILVTDTYQDVVDGGFMQDPEAGGSSTPKVQGITASKINGIIPYRVNGAR